MATLSEAQQMHHEYGRGCGEDHCKQYFVYQPRFMPILTV
jgi:hypothetical protein